MIAQHESPPRTYRPDAFNSTFAAGSPARVASLATRPAQNSVVAPQTVSTRSWSTLSRSAVIYN